MSDLAYDISLVAPGPNAVKGGQAFAIGKPGARDLFYWVVAHYPIGVSIAGPIPILNAPDALNATDAVRIVWDPEIGAINYDVLRTDTPVFPKTASNCMVAGGISGSVAVDQGQGLTAFNPTGLPFGAPAERHIYLNNRDYSQPTIELPEIKVSRIVFPDGSSMTTAGNGPLIASAMLGPDTLKSLSPTNGAVLATPPPGKSIVVLGLFYKFTAGSVPYTIDPSVNAALYVSAKSPDVTRHYVDYQNAKFLTSTIDQRFAWRFGIEYDGHDSFSMAGEPLRLYYIPIAGGPPIAAGNGTLEVIVNYVLNDAGDAGNGIQVAKATFDAPTLCGLSVTNGALIVPAPSPGVTIIPLGMIYSYKAGATPFGYGASDWMAISYEGVSATPAEMNNHYLDYIYAKAVLPADGKDKDSYRENPYDFLDAVRPQFQGKAVRFYNANATPLTNGSGLLTITLAYMLDTATPTGNVVLIRKTLDAATIRSLSSTNGALIYQPPPGYSAYLMGGYFRRKGTVAFTIHAKGNLTLVSEGLDIAKWSYFYRSAGLNLSAGDSDSTFNYGNFGPLDNPYTTSGKPIRLYYGSVEAATPNPLPPITGGDGTLEAVCVFGLTPDPPALPAPPVSSVTIDAATLRSLSPTNSAVASIIPPPDKAIIVLGSFYKFKPGTVAISGPNPNTSFRLTVQGTNNEGNNSQFADYQPAQMLLYAGTGSRFFHSYASDGKYPLTEPTNYYSAIGKPLRLFYVGRASAPIPPPITGGDGATLEVITRYVLNEPGAVGHGIQVAQVTVDAATIRSLSGTNGPVIVPAPPPGAIIIPLGLMYEYRPGQTPFTYTDEDEVFIAYEGGVTTTEPWLRHCVDATPAYALLPPTGGNTSFGNYAEDYEEGGSHFQFAGKSLRLYLNSPTGSQIAGGDGTLTVTLAYILDTATPSGDIVIARQTLDAATIRTLNATTGPLIYQPPPGYSAYVLGGYFRRRGTLAFNTPLTPPATWASLSLATEAPDPYYASHSYYYDQDLLGAGDYDMGHQYGYCNVTAASPARPLRLYHVRGAYNDPPPLPITGGDGTLEVVMVLALTPDS